MTPEEHMNIIESERQAHRNTCAKLEEMVLQLAEARAANRHHLEAANEVRAGLVELATHCRDELEAKQRRRQRGKPFLLATAIGVAYALFVVGTRGEEVAS